MDTQIAEVKATVAKLGEQSGSYALESAEQELVFMGERCLDERRLRDYGISEDFIVQVTGFVVNPDQPGKRFVDGVLVSY